MPRAILDDSPEPEPTPFRHRDYTVADREADQRIHDQDYIDSNWDGER
jgi:hypothetical protein